MQNSSQIGCMMFHCHAWLPRGCWKLPSWDAVGQRNPSKMVDFRFACVLFISSSGFQGTPRPSRCHQFHGFTGWVGMPWGPLYILKSRWFPPIWLSFFKVSFFCIWLGLIIGHRTHPIGKGTHPKYPKIPCFILFHHHLPKDKMAISGSPSADPTSQLRWRCSSAKWPMMPWRCTERLQPRCAWGLPWVAINRPWLGMVHTTHLWWFWRWLMSLLHGFT